MDSDQINSDANKSANNQCFFYFSRLYFICRSFLGWEVMSMNASQMYCIFVWYFYDFEWNFLSGFISVFFCSILNLSKKKTKKLSWFKVIQMRKSYMCIYVCETRIIQNLKEEVYYKGQNEHKNKLDLRISDFKNC